MQIDRAIIVDRLPLALPMGSEVYGPDFVSEMLSMCEDEDDDARLFNGGSRSTVLLFGCTSAGRPMLVRVEDFRPHVYFEHPSNRAAFHRQLAEYLRLEPNELVVRTVHRRNMYGWVPDSNSYPRGERASRICRSSS